MMSNDLNIPKGEVLGHPKGLFLLFATEACERFSYYGMRALLVLSMVAATNAVNPGFGWARPDALKLYAWYTGFVYFTPVIGGWLADNFLGQRKAVIIGALIMAAGQFTLAAAIPKDINLFYIGLVLMVIGNGFFKANISTMVGELYPKGDGRRDGAFTIFYMGINLGAFVAPFVCSTFGEKNLWAYGYAAAGVGMMVGAVIQLFLAQHFIGDLGRKPSAQRSKAQSGGVHKPLTSDERDRLKVIFMLFVFVMLFWTAFEQAGGSMNLFASEQTDRMVSGFEVPAGWFQAVNALFILLLGPVFAILWQVLAARGKSMPTPIKMMSGLLLTGLGFVCMVAAVFETQAHGKANMIWLVLAYLFHTMGELCISPVGLSMVTKLAPLRLASLMMGVWFLINFCANLLAGYIGAYGESAGYMTIFGGLAVFLVAFALLLWAVSGKLVDWMHGAEDVTPESQQTDPENTAAVV
ncbi:MAG TPA: peptide MFS transporter [Burkholderiaceae bacterium]